MLHKQFELLEVKADGDRGEFTAVVSTFGNIDKVGDRILPGAYTKTLQRLAESGDPLPIILAHQWNDPFAHIGYAEAKDIIQTEKGLQVTAKLDVDKNRVAEQVYHLMKGRRLKQFSIGYDVPPGGEKRAKDGANEISEINLAECGPCLIGIDPKTELQSVKSALDTMNLPSAEDQRKEAERVARETEEESLPEVPEPRPEPEPEPEPEPQPEPKSAEELRKSTVAVEREENERSLGEAIADVTKRPIGGVANLKADIERSQEALEALEMFEPDEVAGIKTGLLKAVWTTAYINDLPDSSFLYIAPGGDKDADGKTTPRSLRYFPFKDANGAVDLPHLRNALSRIPQSSLPQDVKDRLTARAQRILDNEKSVEVTDGTPKARSVDPLRERAHAVALEFASDGLSLRRPPKQVSPSKPEPEMDVSVLKARMREEMLTHLSGEST